MGRLKDMRPLIRVLVTVVVLAVLAAACGDDDISSTPDRAEPTDEPTSDAEPTPAGELVRILATSGGVDRAASDPSAPTTELATGLNRAGFDLWSTFDANENLVFSPMSIGHALLMARAAADPSTGAAIDAALQLPGGMSAHDAWNSIDQAMAALAEAEDDMSLSIADAIFPRHDVQPEQAWINLLATHHGAEVQALDFAGAPVAATGHINDWVGEQTQGLIPDLLPAGFVTPETVLVLADAVYFEARWQRVFGKYGPETADFTRLDGSTVEVDYLVELELPSRRGLGPDFAAAEIPYVGDGFSMLVVVPQEDAYPDVRARLLDGRLLAEVETVMDTGPFELWLPPWETKTTVDVELAAWLESIGAAPGAYPGIAPGAFLAEAVHAADIAVDEWGTVAAAATAFGFESSGGPEPQVKIKADKPFLYLIRHQASGLVLFAGQVTDPTT